MKEIVKFQNFDSNISCTVSSVGGRIQIIFDEFPDEETIKSGFYLLNEHNFYIQGDYSEYKYIYKIDEETKTVVLTNDENDVYVEPVTPEVPSVPELTDEEKAAIALEEFNTLKESKIKKNVRCLPGYN